MMIRYASYFMAALLPLLLFRFFASSSVGEIDFWLLWLLAMLVVALPVVYAEIALAYRSTESPLAGMQKLTREADASALWRSYGWLAAIVAIVIAALSLSTASSSLLSAITELSVAADIPLFAIGAGLTVIALLLSLLGAAPLPIGLGLMVLGLVLGVANGLPQISVVMTDISLSEWARATALALVSVGAGTGLYWFAQHLNYSQTLTVANANSNASTNNTKNSSQHRSAAIHRASRLVLPIWLLQVVVGVIALLISGLNLSPIAQISYAIGVVFVVSYLLHYATQQLAHKFGVLISLVLTLVLGVLLVIAVPTAWLVGMLVIVSSIAVLLLSLFVGWQMKISHLRKSLNFANEGFYNVWRIAIRIIVPLALVLALLGWMLQWLS